MPPTRLQLTSRSVLILGLLLCLWPAISPSIAMLIGVVLALIFTNPWPLHTAKYSTQLLKVSIVGLGFSFPIQQVLTTASDTFWLTLATILFSLAMGAVLCRAFRLPPKQALLITGGTAICGGSAIAALAPSVRANHHEILVAVATVFLLNAIALLVFPPLGVWMGFDDNQFGIWTALAIHDTSSVVGAAAARSSEALEIATTTKLARALWIIPLSLLVAGVVSYRDATTKPKGFPLKAIRIPLFIFGFAFASILSSLYWIQLAAPWLALAAKTGMKISLFLIGYGISTASLRQLDVKTWLFAITLWGFSASFSALALMWLSS